jgi:beta-lactamase regulating signal transducer with metallopeptidase domain
MTQIAHAASAALLHFVWQGPVVASLLWITLAFLKRSPARLRYAVSCLALAAMAALPCITACLAYRAPAAPTAYGSEVVNITYFADPSTLDSSAPLPRWLALAEAWTLPVWSAGVLIFAIRLTWSAKHVATLRRSGKTAGGGCLDSASRLAQRMRLFRRVRVLTSELVDAPSVVGWLKPVILLPPATLINLSADQFEAVLAHELAHIRRHDYAINLLQTLVETLFFYQPAIWWVSSRIRNERELCCDDIVVETCGNPVGYARALTQLERLRLDSAAFAMASTGGALKQRIQRLTGVPARQPGSSVSAVLAAAFAIVCVVMNVHWANAQPQRETEGAVSRDAIWVDTVKYGDLPIAVRGGGRMASPTTAELDIPAEISADVQLGQNATIELPKGIHAAGKVTRIDSRRGSGTVPITVQLQASMGEFVGQNVDGLVQIRMLNNVVFVGRPAGPAAAETTLFKIDPDGQHSIRTKVRFGAGSANRVQVLEGLHPGDKVILSDMSKYDGVNRVRLQ